MRTTDLMAPALAAVLLAAPAHAQDAERYTLQKTEDGYIRMDDETGEISICKQRSGQLVCTIAADERTAFQDELERLESEIAALERRITALEEARSPRRDGETSEEEFDKALGFMERFFRRFMDIVKDLEKDFGSPEPEPEKTQRT
jgi:flagellar motility protein MotE (MotC chaperone)